VLNQLSTLPSRGIGEWMYRFRFPNLGTRFHARAVWPQGKRPGTHWWVAKPAWILWNSEEFLALTGNRTPGVQPIACRYTNWAIPNPTCWGCIKYGIVVTPNDDKIGAIWHRKKNKCTKIMHNSQLSPIKKYLQWETVEFLNVVFISETG
jgi:hypothetical protein